MDYMNLIDRAIRRLNAQRKVTSVTKRRRRRNRKKTPPKGQIDLIDPASLHTGKICALCYDDARTSSKNFYIIRSGKRKPGRKEDIVLCENCICEVYYAAIEYNKNPYDVAKLMTKYLMANKVFCDWETYYETYLDDIPECKDRKCYKTMKTIVKRVEDEKAVRISEQNL